MNESLTVRKYLTPQEKPSTDLIAPVALLFKGRAHFFTTPEVNGKFTVDKRVEKILEQFTYKETLQNGMSGAKIMVMEQGGEKFVVKISSKDKTKREAEGYARLQNSHYAHLLPGRNTTFSEDGVLLYEYVPGVEVREGVKKGILPKEEVLSAVEEVATAELGSITEQSYRNDLPVVSMQRQEWEDTIKKVEELTRHFSFGKEENIATYPIIFEGQEFPSLQHALEKTASLLNGTPVFPGVSHNDATGANIKIQEGKAPTLLDYEWAGIGDIPESLVRLLKYNSSSLLTPEHTDIVGRIDEGKLHLSLSGGIPKDALEIQNTLITSLLPKFSALYKEKSGKDERHFIDAFYTYLAGSYLREFALSTKRNPKEWEKYALYALLQSSQVIAQH